MHDFNKQWARMEAQQNKTVRRGIVGFLFASATILVANLLFWGALIFGVIWSLKHFEVI